MTRSGGSSPASLSGSGAEAGVTHTLVRSAVELARREGASAIEGWPLAESGPRLGKCIPWSGAGARRPRFHLRRLAKSRARHHATRAGRELSRSYDASFCLRLTGGRAKEVRWPFGLRWVQVAVGASLRDAEVIEAGAASGYTRRRRGQAPAASPGRTPPALPGCRLRVHRAVPRAGPRACRRQGRHTP